MKNLILYLFLFSSVSIFCQVNMAELQMKTYKKDTTANAVVLFESGNTMVEEKYNKYQLKTSVYKKIKILNDEGKKHATVKIYIYNDENKSSEKVNRIKAITHNLNEPPVHLNPKHIYTNTIHESLKEVTFTFPNVKPGSVLEYQYDLESRFFFNFSGWTFQSDIPKVQSEYHATIPAYWKYNRRLDGLLRLATNRATIKKKCFSIAGSTASCEEVTYIMKDIPAFIEEEKFSTTKHNYLSKIKFELLEVTHPDGTTKRYTSSWKETDKRLKNDESIGKQLKKGSNIAKSLPKEMKAGENKLTQCKLVYQYFQEHFSLNEDKTYIFRDVDVKKAYKEKFGSVSEINLALIAALQGIGIDAKIILLSTRDSGFPTKKYPVMTEFNYLAAHITIDEQTYILDASNDFLSFDMLPFEALNSYGRVLDFENRSYWFSISPTVPTFERMDAAFDMDENGTLTGIMKETNAGYFSKFKREEIHSKNQEAYLNGLENDNTNIKILSYNNKQLKDLEKPLIENFEIEMEATEFIGNNIYLNPFISKYDNNPFQLQQRNYPINFGYKFNEAYNFIVTIPENFVIKSIPKNVAFTLPNDGGIFTAMFKKEGNKVSVYTKLRFNNTIYKSDNYPHLKELFNQIIKTQNSLITLEKTNIN